jgi:hypothetical protein
VHTDPVAAPKKPIGQGTQNEAPVLTPTPSMSFWSSVVKLPTSQEVQPVAFDIEEY